jgi:inorganic pyrophosphatase
MLYMRLAHLFETIALDQFHDAAKPCFHVIGQSCHLSLNTGVEQLYDPRHPVPLYCIFAILGTGGGLRRSGVRIHGLRVRAGRSGPPQVQRPAPLRVLCYPVLVSLYDLDPGPDCPELVRAIVEIPKDSANKYEYGGELGVFRLDRASYSPMHYPGDYGFIPGTLAEDGDPMDVLVLANRPSFSGCLIEVRPIGLLHMVDQQERDQKIIAVPKKDPRYTEVHTMDQVYPHTRRELEHFFTIY